MAVKESYEMTLDVMKESALGVAKLSGDDYQKGLKQELILLRILF